MNYAGILALPMMLPRQMPVEHHPALGFPALQCLQPPIFTILTPSNQDPALGPPRQES